MRTSRHPHRVEFGECDPFGIVYFPRYLEMLDAATAALFDAAGVPLTQLLDDGIGIPLVTVNVEFHRPATFGDQLVVVSRVARWGDSSFDLEHEVRRGEDLVATATARRVWTRREGARLAGVTVPDDIRRRFLA
ncbi:MAG: acyl-CoA thioesterase [Vicinamibacterales bacterium]